jgi:hypothetical protein
MSCRSSCSIFGLLSSLLSGCLAVETPIANLASPAGFLDSISSAEGVGDSLALRLSCSSPGHFVVTLIVHRLYDNTIAKQ